MVLTCYKAKSESVDTVSCSVLPNVAVSESDQSRGQRRDRYVGEWIRRPTGICNRDSYSDMMDGQRRSRRPILPLAYMPL